MNSLLKIFTLTILITSTDLYAGNKIIKWVDKDGVTQYGDKLPMPNSAEKASILSNQGVTLQHINQKSSSSVRDEALATQTRQDNALLASYNSIEEIDVARKRNVKTDELALIALQQKLDSLRQQLPSNYKHISSPNTDKPIASTVIVTIDEQMEADLSKLQLQIKAKEKTIDEINQRYEKDKVRFAELENRKGKLHDIKYAKKNIADLEKWRADAQRKVQYFEEKNLQLKRSGNEIPSSIKTGLLNATQELERANAEIESNNIAIKESKEQLSR